MYDPPVDIIYDKVKYNLENGIMEAIQRVGINVDKTELLRAMQYDRDQYNKGFSDGKLSGYAERDMEIVRCSDCKHYDPNTEFCDIHSHFITRDGEFCYPSESSEWKMFSPDYFCGDGKRRMDEQ